MGAFLSYSITSGLVMLAMYLGYRLFLARDKQHTFNRAVLLTIYLVSFATAPAIALIGRLSAASTTGGLSVSGLDIAGGIVTETAKPICGTVLIWIFIAGMAVVTFRTLATWTKLIRVIRSGEKIPADGYVLVVTDRESYAPFSWMRYVVISRRDYAENSRAIVAHELKHVASRHWIDLLIAQAACIVNWFNPAAWLMRDELMLVHEYQADMAVIDLGCDAQAYQMLLIKKAVGSRFPSLANSLNHSKLKKRITMMYKEESRAGRRFRALALVPMVALAIGVASVSAVRAAVSTIRNSEISTSEVSEKTSEDKTLNQKLRLTNVNVDDGIMTVIIKGTDLGNHINVGAGKLTSAGRTLDAKSLRCQLTDGTASIIAAFDAPEPSEKLTMTLDINGKETSFDLTSLSGTSDIRIVGFGTMKKDGTSVSDAATATTSSEQLKSFTYYIDGKQSTLDELNDLDPSKIMSVVVDKKNNAIRIETK